MIFVKVVHTMLFMQLLLNILLIYNTISFGLHFISRLSKLHFACLPLIYNIHAFPLVCIMAVKKVKNSTTIKPFPRLVISSTRPDHRNWAKCTKHKTENNNKLFEMKLKLSEPNDMCHDWEFSHWLRIKYKFWFLFRNRRRGTLHKSIKAIIDQNFGCNLRNERWWNFNANILHYSAHHFMNLQ